MRMLLMLGIIFSVSVFARERGFDRETKISKADLICGRVNGKFIIISTELKKAWYLFGEDRAVYARLKNVRHSSEIEGLKAFEYGLVSSQVTRFPDSSGAGSFIVSYKCSKERSCFDSSFINIRHTASGQLRIFPGENGANGVCKLI